MKYALAILLLICFSVSSIARHFQTTSRPTEPGNKTLHLYNGTIEIVEDGFVVTFFYSGNYQLTIKGNNGEVIVDTEISATANLPIYIMANGISPDYDTVNETF